MTEVKFSDLGLADPIQRALSARNHTTPTPIQAQAIPKLLAGRDVLGIAQTGTGKTAAFALPILNRLAHNPAPKHGRRQIRALILAPTRELAIQIGEEIQAYAKNLRVFQAVIFGGVSQKPQVDKLNRGIDIAVATPGRLLDLMNQRHVDLRNVDCLVLDEADRMLDMGFVRDVRKIIAALPEKRQSLLFSATMPSDIARLSKEILNDPVRVEVTPPSTPVERIRQSVHHVQAADKRKLLADILSDQDLSKVIVFTRTKHRANRVAEYLDKAGISAEAIHGNKSQGARQRALKSFKAGGVRVLVATDIAARGIDVDAISHVVNFELPNEPESYVHRIGRTARAGAEGLAVAFCDPGERTYLRDIERLIGMRLTVVGDGPVGPATAEPHRGGGNKQHRHGGASRGQSQGHSGGRSEDKPQGKSRRPHRRRRGGNGSGGHHHSRAA